METRALNDIDFPSAWHSDKWSDKAKFAMVPFWQQIQDGGVAFGFGPGHIVFEDDNLEDDHLQYCIGECDKEDGWQNLPARERGIIKGALETLLAIPFEERITELYQREPD